MRSIIILLAGILFTSSSAFAQIYPHRTELERQNLNGSVELITDISRSYSPQAKRWEPMAVTSIVHLNRQGKILKRGIYISREQSDRDLYFYNAEDSSALPVLDITRMMLESGKSEPFEEYLYAYDEEGRLAGIVERRYKTGQTIKRQYTYERGRLATIISRDSASQLIMEIEQFFYQKDGRPSGSSVRHFEAQGNPVRKLADTARVAADRISKVYTSYVYTDTATPVIYWHWTFGNDTVVDKQEIKRYLANGMLSASTIQMFNSGKTTSSQSYLFNIYGDILSSAASYGNDTTYERGFDYIYEGLDDRKNWTVRRQYLGRRGTDSTAGERLLLSRTDRKIEYYKR